jgi:hypothetical protein
MKNCTTCRWRANDTRGTNLHCGIGEMDRQLRKLYSFVVVETRVTSTMCCGQWAPDDREPNDLALGGTNTTTVLRRRVEAKAQMAQLLTRIFVELGLEKSDEQAEVPSEQDDPPR